MTTPSNVTPNIKKFLKEIGLFSQPQYLKYTCVSPDYRARYCLDNCELEHKRSGCQIVYGWIIWEEIKRACIVAEFHGVVKLQGELIDITPRVDGEDTVLFVQDGSRKPRRVNSYTWSTWSNFSSMNGHIVPSEAKNKQDIVKKWPLFAKLVVNLFSLLAKLRKGNGK